MEEEEHEGGGVQDGFLEECAMMLQTMLATLRSPLVFPWTCLLPSLLPSRSLFPFLPSHAPNQSAYTHTHTHAHTGARARFIDIKLDLI